MDRFEIHNVFNSGAINRTQLLSLLSIAVLSVRSGGSILIGATDQAFGSPEKIERLGEEMGLNVKFIVKDVDGTPSDYDLGLFKRHIGLPYGKARSIASGFFLAWLIKPRATSSGVIRFKTS